MRLQPWLWTTGHAICQVEEYGYNPGNKPGQPPNDPDLSWVHAHMHRSEPAVILTTARFPVMSVNRLPLWFQARERQPQRVRLVQEKLRCENIMNLHLKRENCVSNHTKNEEFVKTITTKRGNLYLK